MLNTMNDHISIYTDGSSRGNPGPGGYGVLLMFNGKRKELNKGFRLTTNNRMELLAVIDGLKALKHNELPVHIYSDSQYVVKAIKEKWLDKWIKTGFKGGKKNRDLWEEFYLMSKKFDLQFHWVRGHADNPFNNRCDELATAAADGKALFRDDGYENGIND
jgi:ribonuclease HI